MTRMELERIYYLKKELAMWQERWAELQADIALGTKTLDGMPRTATNGINKPTEDKAVKLEEVSKIIEGKINEIQYAVCEVDKFILTIEDPLMRIIVRCRCCQLMKWERVVDQLCEELCEADEVDIETINAESVRQMYHRFVKDLPR